MSKIILTGDRPTGRLHIGHYVGSLRNRVAIQNQGDYDKMYVMIADAQALGDNHDNIQKIRDNILKNPNEAVLYSGGNSDKTKEFRKSMVVYRKNDAGSQRRREKAGKIVYRNEKSH